MRSLETGDTRMIVDACLEHGLLRNQCAYVLATALHETASTMKPVREYGGEKYLKAKKYYPYVGMGYVQLTWRENYDKAGKKLGVDFLANPKLLLKAEYAAPILVIGCRDGWFTGKKLSDYITLTNSDFVGARRIVNGTDKAQQIAIYARQYDKLLKGVGYGVEPTPALPSDPGKVFHVEDKPLSINPGPAPKTEERNIFWRALFAVLGWFSAPKK